jgi:hypothetical protein
VREDIVESKDDAEGDKKVAGAPSKRRKISVDDE